MVDPTGILDRRWEHVANGALARTKNAACKALTSLCGSEARAGDLFTRGGTPLALAAAMRLFLLPLLVSCALLGFGQDGSQRELPARDRVAGTARDASARTDTPVVAAGDVAIEQDERITKLMDQYAAHKHPLKGFRVQIFLGSDRDKAREMRRSFLVKHPDVGGYESYLAPNFRIRVGDLRTRLEAERLRDELKAEYPGCYIVPDEIELPRIPEVK